MSRLASSKTHSHALLWLSQKISENKQENICDILNVLKGEGVLATQAMDDTIWFSSWPHLTSPINRLFMKRSQYSFQFSTGVASGQSQEFPQHLAFLFLFHPSYGSEILKKEHYSSEVYVSTIFYFRLG